MIILILSLYGAIPCFSLGAQLSSFPNQTSFLTQRNVKTPRNNFLSDLFLAPAGQGYRDRTSDKKLFKAYSTTA